MGLIGKKIRKLRFEAKKTQKEIAELLGISIPAFSKIEAGITDINSSRMIQLAAVFNIHPSWFFLSESEEDMRSSNLKKLEEELLFLQKTVGELQEKLIRSMEENNDLMKTFLKY